MPNLKVMFRVDASIEIGTGHVMRCLTLAEALASNGVNSEFICRPHKGNLINKIQANGYIVHKLPCSTLQQLDVSSEHSRWLGKTEPTDALETVAILEKERPWWLIVDHYGITKKWEIMVKDSCNYLMVIDDLADRAHSCDILLDHGLGRHKSDYEGLLPGETNVLCGAEFALIQRRFVQLRQSSLKRRKKPKLKNILISMGGVDKDNITSQILKDLAHSELEDQTQIIVVVGEKFPHQVEVRKQIENSRFNAQLLVDVESVAQLMHDADLAIGAAGTTAWERCCLGLPTIVFSLAQNQNTIAQALDDFGAAIFVKHVSMFADILKDLMPSLNSSEFLRKTSLKASQITHGHGVDMVVREIMAYKGLSHEK